MFLEERLHILHVHSVVLVWVELEGRGLKLLVAETPVVKELDILLVVERKTGNFTTLPGEMAQVSRTVQGTQEEETVVEQTPLRDVFELNGIGCLHHFSLNI